MDGQLMLGVFSESVGSPCPGAMIVVSNVDNDKIVEQLITGEDGTTDIVNLSAPSNELSQVPERIEQPYSEYNVTVTAPGYETVRIEGVQIFADAPAIQNVTLAEGSQDSLRTIRIKPHVLWGDFPPKIPEDEVKPLPNPTGFVVLDKPVVPELIVVHDGLPDNANAKNYYVPFKDYIKNVASCEIYSTWPEETIRSNILAIISFTLNRVFTEWYRNKGKNFTITNSTAYDHAFVYGRNIFKEISQITDDIFTTYITRPNIRQPLFAQYCDGKKSLCPGQLSQWGSKDLGDRGLSSMDILRNYYGTDIYLSEAEKVMGVPTSFPGKTLSIGSQGKDVTTIQKQLNVIANNYPSIKKIVEDGKYGPKTVEAVKEFQGIFKMPQTGEVDFATWYRISDIYVAVAKLVS